MHPTAGSLGSLIIDDIRLSDGRELLNVIGGAGVFAVYGMRVWLPGSQAKRIGYVAQRGFDHPKSIDVALESLNINLISHTHPDKHTTRGLNILKANDHRDFEYIHPIIRTTPADFPDEWIQSMTMVHIICSTERTIEIVEEWRHREKKLGKQQKTQFLWEPLPWACLAENYQEIIRAGTYVDVISPNHEEAATFLGLIENGAAVTDIIALVDKSLRQLATDLPHATVVVRAGRHGAAVFDKSTASTKWVPAYWTSPDHVTDVVGAGNAFCGGFIIGWQETAGDAILSVMYGSVASSFIVEQVGVPRLSQNENWNNGPSPRERLKQLKERCS